MGAFSCFAARSSLDLTGSVVEGGGVGTGEMSLVLTDLTRRGAGAGGGSFPVESED